MGNLQPQFLLPSLSSCGIAAELAQESGLAAEGLTAQLLLVSAPRRLSHAFDSTHVQPKQTLFTSRVGFKFCSFYSCFSFRFFWLVQVRQAISTLRLKGENTACKRAEDVRVLWWCSFSRGPGKAHPRIESISQVLALRLVAPHCLHPAWLPQCFWSPTLNPQPGPTPKASTLCI